MMKNQFPKSIWLAALLLILACNFNVTRPGATATPSSLTAEPVETLPPAITEAPTNVASEGITVSFAGTTFTIPLGLATGTTNEIKPLTSANDGIPYLASPAHTQFKLEGYPLQGTLHEPIIAVYPVEEYKQMNEGAQTTINDLQNILAAQRASPTEHMPFLPLFNANQVFHIQEKFINFQNGGGVRFITQYDQAPLPINNNEIFYAFQGITADGAYYVSLIMPVSLPYLHTDSTLFATAPADGVQLDWEHPENFQNYLNTVVDKISKTDPNAFNPLLSTLDSMVQTLLVPGRQ